MITAISHSSRALSSVRNRWADASESSGSKTTVPAGVLLASTPAAARTNPSFVCTIFVDSPRRQLRRNESVGVVVDYRITGFGLHCSTFGLRNDLAGDDDDVPVDHATGAIGPLGCGQRGSKDRGQIIIDFESAIDVNGEAH